MTLTTTLPAMTPAQIQAGRLAELFRDGMIPSVVAEMESARPARGRELAALITMDLAKRSPYAAGRFLRLLDCLA